MRTIKSKEQKMDMMIVKQSYLKPKTIMSTHKTYFSLNLV